MHASLPQDVVHEAGILQLGNNNISLPPNQTTTLEEEFSTSGILNGINIEPPNANSELKIFERGEVTNVDLPAMTIFLSSVSI